MSVRGVEAPPAISGISDVKLDADSLSFLYSGEVALLLGALSDMNVTDVNIQDPELEEIFMNYYVKEDK